VWESHTGKLLAAMDLGFLGSTGLPNAAFSPDAKLLITSGGSKVQLWKASTGRLIRELKESKDTAARAQWSPDGTLIAAINGSDVRVWDPVSSKPIVVLNHETPLYDLKFSPDGKHLVATGTSTARVWEVGTWRSIELRGHNDAVWRAAFSPDSKFVVTAGNDQTVRVWDVNSGQDLLVLPEVDEFQGENGLVVDSAGTLLITATGNRAAQIFACQECLSLEKLRERICDRVTRVLTVSERRFFLHESEEEARREQVPSCSLRP